MSGPVRYDLVRGDVTSLSLNPDGSTSLGDVACVEDNSPDPKVEKHEKQDDPDPFPGNAFFFVIRGTEGQLGDPGSYGLSSLQKSRSPASGDCKP